MKSDNNNMAELLRFEKSLTFTNKITLTKSIPGEAASVELSDFDLNVLEEYENRYAFQRAYAAKAFPVDKPLSLSGIEHYLQILIPA